AGDPGGDEIDAGPRVGGLGLQALLAELGDGRCDRAVAGLLAHGNTSIVTRTRTGRAVVDQPSQRPRANLQRSRACSRVANVTLIGWSSASRWPSRSPRSK